MLSGVFIENLKPKEAAVARILAAISIPEVIVK